MPVAFPDPVQKGNGTMSSLGARERSTETSGLSLVSLLLLLCHLFSTGGLLDSG